MAHSRTRAHGDPSSRPRAHERPGSRFRSRPGGRKSAQGGTRDGALHARLRLHDIRRAPRARVLLARARTQAGSSRRAVACACPAVIASTVPDRRQRAAGTSTFQHPESGRRRQELHASEGLHLRATKRLPPGARVDRDDQTRHDSGSSCAARAPMRSSISVRARRLTPSRPPWQLKEPGRTRLPRDISAQTNPSAKEQHFVCVFTTRLRSEPTVRFMALSRGIGCRSCEYAARDEATCHEMLARS